MNQKILEDIRTPYKINRLLLRPSYKRGEVDSHTVDTPFLFWYEGRYRMFHNCFDGVGYRTGLASSDDLLVWDREGIVHERGEPGSLTEFSVHITSVLRDSALLGKGEAVPFEGGLLGVWQSYPERGQEQGRGYIGIARGQGLCQWELDSPCLLPDEGDRWETGGLYKPCLVEKEGRYYIFYNAKDTLHWPWREQIGVAWSDDLVKWTRHQANPIVANGGPGSMDEVFAADPCVLRWGERWVMFYYGLAEDGHARELAAFSEDLLTWEKAEEVLVDVGGEGSLDSQYAHKPGVIARDGILYHFYAASRKKGPEDIDEVNAKDRRGITVATGQRIE